MYYDYDELYSRPQVAISPILQPTPRPIGTGVYPTPVAPTTPPPVGTGVYPTNLGIPILVTYQQIASLTLQQKQVLMYWLQQSQ